MQEINWKISSFNVSEHSTSYSLHQYIHINNILSYTFIFTLLGDILQPCIHYTFNDNSEFLSINGCQCYTAHFDTIDRQLYIPNIYHLPLKPNNVYTKMFNISLNSHL